MSMRPYEFPSSGVIYYSSYNGDRASSISLLYSLGEGRSLALSTNDLRIRKSVFYQMFECLAITELSSKARYEEN